MHPDEDKSWIINTGASGKAIGSVLMQQDENGDFHVITTASRVLKPAEQQCITCEKELLCNYLCFTALQDLYLWEQGHLIYR